MVVRLLNAKMGVTVNTPDRVRHAVLNEAATIVRIKAFLVAGKTPVEVYSLYAGLLDKAPQTELEPELKKELLAEIKARISFAWPEVRKQVLTVYGPARVASKFRNRRDLSAYPQAKTIKKEGEK